MHQQLDKLNTLQLYENKLKRYNHRIKELEQQLSLEKEKALDYKSRYDSLNNLKKQIQDAKTINFHNEISDLQFLSILSKKIDAMNWTAAAEDPAPAKPTEQITHIVKTLKGGRQNP